MAEWSKAPDSRFIPYLRSRVFWSTYVGVGSNPTSDKPVFFSIHFFAMQLYSIARVRLPRSARYSSPVSSKAFIYTQLTFNLLYHFLILNVYRLLILLRRSTMDRRRAEKDARMATTV